MKYGHFHTFKNNTFVKPLYRKIKFKKTRSKILDYPKNLDGEDANESVKKICEVKKKTRINKCVHERYKVSRPRINNFLACDRVIDNNCVRNYVNDDNSELGDRMLHVKENDDVNSKNRHAKRTQTNKQIHKGDCWLRIYPATKRDENSIRSLMFRCTMCQLGLAAILILWNILWLFVINSFEEPCEIKITEEFEREQNQLVIDLATELRQITPLSPKWRLAIERRIEDERQLTMSAVGRGAKLHPGQFWDLPGTFLFTIYVMTALGFGAPVPQTIWGRTSALIYAFLAIPIHIYLIYNVSTCLVVNVEKYMERRKRPVRSIDNRNSPVIDKNNQQNLKPSRNLRKKLLYIFSIITAGRCVPLVTVIYYTFGALCFGLARQNDALHTIMFPLEFTATGGLDLAEGYVRVLYAFYIEGATCLLACAVVTMRRHSSDTVNRIADKYNLFQDENDIV